MLTVSVERTSRASHGLPPRLGFRQGQSAEAYEIRDFLMRSVVEFEWIACNDDCHEQLGLPEFANVRLPVVISKRPSPSSRIHPRRCSLRIKPTTTGRPCDEISSSTAKHIVARCHDGPG
jgi:hypothetical protein